MTAINIEAHSPEAYLRATPSRFLGFPSDHGPHLDYQTEWWYYTGNLTSHEGDQFGYQLTFFRRALTPAAERKERLSTWTADQVYMAHFTFTDVSRENFRFFERFSRTGVGLAGAQASPYQVWLLDWQVNEIEPGIYQLNAGEEDLEIELILRDKKGPILQGDQGYSQKSSHPGNASHYYSLTRLITDGVVYTKDNSYQVSGTSWMDHEFSTSALSDGQIGWDWFSIQLDDQSELMLFQIRREDSSIDPFSSGTWISADGSTQQLALGDFEITVQNTWHSPHTGATYPAKWNISIPSQKLILEITPQLPDQELRVSYSYWEGAVRVQGRINDTIATGNGYVELTGYAGSISGQF
jgi:predicted secreted hydrolase